VGFRQFGLDGSYRLFSMVFVLGAIAVLLETRSTRNLLIAGIICGIASFFGQQRGIVGIAAISGFLIWENYKNGFDFRSLVRNGVVITAAFLVTVIVTQSYFVWQAGADNYYFAMVGFLQNNYRHDPLNNFGAYLSDLPDLGAYLSVDSGASTLFRYARVFFATWFYYALIPGIYLLFIIFKTWSRSTGSTVESSKSVLLFFTGTFLAASITAPTATRLYHVAVPGIILLVWLIVQSRRLNQLIPIALLLFGAVGAAYTVQRQTVEKYYLDMPAGYAAFLYEPTFEKYSWIGANTRPGEFIYEANHPNFYFPFYLRNPTPLPLVRDSEYTPAFQIESVVAALEKKRPQLIIWSAKWTKAADERATDDHLEPLWQCIKTNYELIHVFKNSDDPMLARSGDDEVWRLKP
jgi:hypothetical protein